MASSAKRRPTPDPLAARLLAAVRAAVEQAFAASEPARGAAASSALRRTAKKVSASLRARKPRAVTASLLADNAQARSARDARDNADATTSEPLLIAYSGGIDSHTLLDLCCRLRAERAEGFRALHAVHVHHGLQPLADTWVEHCRAVCNELAVPLDVRHVAVDRRRGIEAGARAARYEAIFAVAQEVHAPLVLAAHHRDDRIETFLIQWLRGAGPDGLAAFPAQRVVAPGIDLLRPLAAIARSEIADYASARALKFVEDPSNADTRLLRNALRATVLPALRAAKPGFEIAAVRSIDLVAESAEALREVAAQDFAWASDAIDRTGGRAMLRLDRLQQLPPARRALVVRHWLAAFGVEAPPRARLQELLAQAAHARSDARMLVRIGALEVRRYRGLLLARSEQATAHAQSAIVQWNDEAEIAVPSWGGALRFVATEAEGFDPEWLRAQPLELRARTGGERFKPHPTRPSKTLKRLFQDAGIAEFERARLPLVWRDEQLIFVAQLGADARLIEADGPRVRLEWLADAGLLA